MKESTKDLIIAFFLVQGAIFVYRVWQRVDTWQVKGLSYLLLFAAVICVITSIYSSWEEYQAKQVNDQAENDVRGEPSNWGYCPHCGMKDQGTPFCPNCGRKS